MVMVKSFEFNYQEVIEALIKAQGIEEGIWALEFRIKQGATNMNENGQMLPTVFSMITGVGLTRVETETNLTVDASKLHPLH